MNSSTTIIAPVLTAVATALVALVTAATGWAVAWVKKKIRENEAANAEIDRHVAATTVATQANAATLAQVNARVDELHGLVNGRLSQLLTVTAELGAMQAALAHTKGIEAGKLGVPLPGADEAIAAAKLKLIEAASEAKRILAEAATATKEALDKDAILGPRNRRADDPKPDLRPATTGTESAPAYPPEPSEAPHSESSGDRASVPLGG